MEHGKRTVEFIGFAQNFMSCKNPEEAMIVKDQNGRLRSYDKVKAAWEEEDAKGGYHGLQNGSKL